VQPEPEGEAVSEPVSLFQAVMIMTATLTLAVLLVFACEGWRK
jgi:hypothetical protein